MGRIVDRNLQALADQWSPTVRELLDEIGRQTWPPLKQRRGILGGSVLISRYSLEGPVQRNGELFWALSHTSKPSSFDDRGVLSEGERQFWLLALHPGDPPCFRLEGAAVHDSVPANAVVLREALHRARQAGPKIEAFYGNKGPLSHH